MSILEWVFVVVAGILLSVLVAIWPVPVLVGASCFIAGFFVGRVDEITK